MDPTHHAANSGVNGATTAALPPEAIEFAARMYDSARRGDMPIFQQALPAGLPSNMTNEKGDTLVGSLYPRANSKHCIMYTEC